MNQIPHRIISVLMFCLITASVNAQKPPILDPQMDLIKSKSVESSATKETCSGVICPEGKTCHDGCCIYPLGRKAEGNWNYIIASDCNSMKDLKLSFKVTKDLEAEYDVAANCAQVPKATDKKLDSTQGVVVQFNCFSMDADKQKNVGGMIQYIFYVEGQSVTPHIQYVTGTPDGLDHDWLWQGNNSFPDLQLPKANTLPAGYTLEVEFATDEHGFVNEVTFKVLDDKGKSYVMKAPEKGAHPQGATTSHPETLYPVRITEFQTNVVSTNGLYVHYKAGGEGTLTYSSKEKLCVEGGSYEHCVNASIETCESSNAIYGNLSSCCSEPGKAFSQSVSIK
jgi:hypothetical protein